ncbi:acylneuraminate cytidylyltransferase [Pseudogulbenkiania sp. NH8B]|uniref:pseudaminic acid cytidylyltransferase n=1 Tax=Pseudogulbenkiania sp. (strain NH8B) TaxID=748280 RepID=UPI000227A59D|nr:pseudaminic acid cytidylyltransferase [Pseudogulbenkiania sp. NH8B]BAK78296.1 acylneuraminate cytidylyltransferase [Pseudogulbenkiania sp. NH8B]
MRLAIIPARGGSKRIPGKNIRPFCGRPILAYSIQAARDSDLFDRIIVSTDSPQIAEVARLYGAEVPFWRSETNSDDYATLLDVLQEVLGQLAERGEHYAEVCCLLPTAPLVTAKRLQQAHTLLEQKGYDAIFPIVRFGYPIQRALRQTEDGHVAMLQPEHYRTRSQDLPTAFHDAGQFYSFRPEPCFAAGKMFTDNSGGIEISELEAQDIDGETDWALCELKYQLLQKHR